MKRGDSDICNRRGYQLKKCFSNYNAAEKVCLRRKEKRGCRSLDPTNSKRKRSSAFCFRLFLAMESKPKADPFFFVCFENDPNAGKQVSEVLGFYVESAFMGHGNCCHHGHCFGQWRGNYNVLI